jgi:SAM-dependent methyltransferase
MNRFHRWYCRTDHWRRIAQEQLLPWVLGDADLGAHALEVGPGPGLMTDVLRTRVPALTALEIDPALATALRARHPGDNVTVVEGDGTAMPFADATFTGALSCTMLHHVPSADLQDRLLAEVLRVLRPGAWFVGSDSTTSLLFRLAHLFDTMVPVDPDAFAARLARAGFTDVAVRRGEGAFRFRGRRAVLRERAGLAGAGARAVAAHAVDAVAALTLEAVEARAAQRLLALPRRRTCRRRRCRTRRSSRCR